MNNCFERTCPYYRELLSLLDASLIFTNCRKISPIVEICVQTLYLLRFFFLCFVFLFAFCSATYISIEPQLAVPFLFFTSETMLSIPRISELFTIIVVV